VVEHRIQTGTAPGPDSRRFVGPMANLAPLLDSLVRQPASSDHATSLTLGYLSAMHHFAGSSVAKHSPPPHGSVGTLAIHRA